MTETPGEYVMRLYRQIEADYPNGLLDIRPIEDEDAKYCLKLQAAVNRVRRLHRENPIGFCEHCARPHGPGVRWPCPTFTAVDFKP